MLEKNKLLSYAMDCASYIISKVEDINRIILHGSTTRGDFDEESDIDLFIDTKNKKLEKTVQNVLNNYYKKDTYKKWELKGINNPISIIVGNLDSDEWKDLKRAMMNTGIILYGKYKASAEKVNHYTLFSFENIKPDKKRVAIHRKLFGFNLNKKNYPGLIEKFNAIKINKGTILIPKEYVNKLKEYFQKQKITIKLYDFWSDTKL